MNGVRNPMKYSPGVLVGNWYEDMRVREDKVAFYKSKFLENTLPGLREKTFTHLSEVTCISDMKDFIVFGQPLQLVNVATGAALALDTDPQLSPNPPNHCLVTATDAGQPQIRSTWVIHKAKDENNAAYTEQLKEKNVMHYGQHVRIVNEDADPKGFYYLHSGVRDLGDTGEQQLTAALTACKDNTFVIAKPGDKRDDIRNGGPVRVGESVVLYHASTNQPVRCTRTRRKTSFGNEFHVSCSFVLGNRSRSVSAVAAHSENLFLICAPARLNSTNTSAATAFMRRSEGSETMSLSMSCGIGVDAVIARIRDGALHFGGRLGFRAISKAMGVACNEQRTTPLNRQQVHNSVRLMGVSIQPLELDVIFKRYDHSGNGLIVAQEFLRELRWDMPPCRLDAVIKAFQALTIEGGGSVDYKDMLNLFKFNAPLHPDVEECVLTCEEVIFDFINCWPGKNNTGTVTLEEFLAYYTDVSPAIKEDERFSITVERCWAIPETDAYKSGKPRRCVTVLHSDDTTETICFPDSLIMDARDVAAVRGILVQHGVRDIKDFWLKA